MNKKLLNTQIAAINKEDGPKIVAFYKKHGFDTRTLEKSSYYRDEDMYYYYGVNNAGRFDIRNFNNDLKTITLEEANALVNSINKVTEADLIGHIKDFPLHIVQLMCEEQVLQGNPFDPKTFQEHYYKDKSSGGFTHKDARLYPEHIWHSVIMHKKFHLIPRLITTTYPRLMLVKSKTEEVKRVVIGQLYGKYITYNGIDDLSKLPLKDDFRIGHCNTWDYAEEIPEKSKFPFTLKPEEAQSIIDVACSSWKSKLFDMWGKEIVLKKNITVDKNQYNDMRKACTSEQNGLFDKIFGKN